MLRRFAGRIAGSTVVAAIALSGCTAHPSAVSASPSAGRQSASGFRGSLPGTDHHGHTYTFDYALSVGSPQRAAKPDQFGRDVLTLSVTVDAKVTNTTSGGDPRGISITTPFVVLGGFYQATRAVCGAAYTILVTLTQPSGAYCFLPLYDLDQQGRFPPKGAAFPLTGAPPLADVDRAAGFTGDGVVLHAGDSGYPKLAADLQAGPDIWALGASPDYFGKSACELPITSKYRGYGFVAAQPAPPPAC